MILCVFLLLVIIGRTVFQQLGINKYVNGTREDFLICMFFTGGLKEEAENSIQTLKNVGLSDKLVVTALDDEAYLHMKELGIKVEKRQTNLEKLTHYGTKAFKRINLNKYDIISNLLQKEKKIVVYVDPDVIFFEDISGDVVKFKNSNYDVMFQNDIVVFDESAKKKLCTGFIFLKPNQKTMDLLKITQENSIKRGLLDDQDSMNMVYNQKSYGINLGVFDLKEYPNGKRYFHYLETIYKEYRPKIVHNNHLLKTIDKIDRLKKHGLWFLPPRR